MPSFDNVEAIRAALIATTALSDDQTKALTQVITATAEPGIRQALLGMYNHLAGQLSEQLPDTEIQVQLVNSEPRLIARPTAISSRITNEIAPDPAEEQIRTTVRLPRHLRDDVETAAKLTGTSINSWLVNAIHQAIQRDRTKTPPHTNRPTAKSISGWYA